MDFNKTLNLPNTDFPMRADLVKREPVWQKFWADRDITRKAVEQNRPNGVFILHDGPPYSNGNIHMGHALNKILKDFIVKYKTVRGYSAPYVPGWDNHGMPIENEVTKEFRAKKQNPDKVALRKRCRSYAAEYVEKQKAQFLRLGVSGDWDHPYLTMTPHFEATIVRVFGELVEKGFVYRGLKPVLWCPVCETALADAEVEYHEHTSHSIMVKFPLLSDAKQLADGLKDPHVVIWTTTPWTIPANLAVAVHPDEEYSWVNTSLGTLLMATALIANVVDVCGLEWHEVVRTSTGRELEGLVFKHPLYDRESPVVLADYVTMTDGTGVVHTAPGHGEDDFRTGKRYGLDAYCPVDGSGHYNQTVGERLAGLHIKEANGVVIEWLRENGALLDHTPFEHQYPNCWRCRSALIFRATTQWFMSIDHNDHRQKCIESIKQTKWYPAQSINRITSMVEGRPDWCLSRQRSWGVNIPAFHCMDCGEVLLDAQIIASVADKVEASSADVWYEQPAEFFLPEGQKCVGCGSTKFEKETDILDVWFDSGSTNRAVLESRPDLHWPADVYLEGSDQHRGWFNSSLMVGQATKGRAPYNTVITNGWMLDGQGRAMHKSLGNVISPLDVIAKYGADVMRLWVASVNYMEDVRLSYDILDRTSENFRRIRNTARFILGNVSDFDVATQAVAEADLLPLDRWALARLREVMNNCRGFYDEFEFNKVYLEAHLFCAQDLSGFYLDVLKDRLYASKADSLERRSAQTVLLEICKRLAQVLAPIMTHTSEEIWQALPIADKQESVMLSTLECQDFTEADAAVVANWLPVLELREVVYKAIEEFRQGGEMKRSQEAAVAVALPADQKAAIADYTAMLADLFMVESVELTEGDTLLATISKAAGDKCPRCWLIKSDIGANTAQPEVCGRCAEALS